MTEWTSHLTFGGFWAGYTGIPDQNAPHAHLTIQVAVGLGSEVHVELRHGSLSGRGVVIGSFEEHIITAASNRVALLYVYPGAPLGRALQGMLQGKPVALLENNFIDSLLSAKNFHAAVMAMTRILDAEEVLDRRLAKALDILRKDAGHSGAIGRAASAVAISEPRLRYLAGSQIGVPLSQWALWQKLERAVEAVSDGATLVEAAALGGFSDQAHFSRVIRRMFGVNASVVANVLRNSNGEFKFFKNDEVTY